MHIRVFGADIWCFSHDVVPISIGKSSCIEVGTGGRTDGAGMLFARLCQRNVIENSTLWSEIHMTHQSIRFKQIQFEVIPGKQIKPEWTPPRSAPKLFRSLIRQMIAYRLIILVMFDLCCLVIPTRPLILEHGMWHMSTASNCLRHLLPSNWYWCCWFYRFVQDLSNETIHSQLIVIICDWSSVISFN